MINVEFIYNGQSIIIQSNSEVIIKEILHKFTIKTETELNSLYFLYGGKVINHELSLSQMIGPQTKDNITILVYQNSSDNNNNPSNAIVRPKFIMCPKCNENIRYNIIDYKINLFDCRNGHKINNISLNEFNQIQQYDMSKIICQQCKIQNKKETSFNQFFKCITCEIYLCPLCKTIHDKTHNIINLDNNYICSMHNESYSKYCLDCKINSCIQCSNSHKDHNNVYFGDIMPNIDEIKNKLKELRISIDLFKQNINDIIKKLNNIVDNFEIYYTLNESLVKNYNNKNRNYEFLKNINEINNSNDIIRALNDINNDKDIINKLYKVFDVYHLMNNEEEIKNEIIINNKIDKKYSKEELFSNFEIVYETLNKIKGNISYLRNFDFYKFISSLLLYEYKSNNNSKYRELIIEKILEKNELIKYSSPIINIIMENIGISSEPKKFENNIKYIKDADNPILLLLNKTKNDFLEEIIMNAFERKVMKYFESIPYLDENELEDLFQIYYEQNEKGKITNKTGIIFDKSFSVFKDVINILNDITYQKNKKNTDNSNLIKLYSIVYVKLYLYHMTYFLINNYHEMNNSIKDVIQYINEITNKSFCKVIKIYILKLIFNFTNSSFEEFKNFRFEKIGINFYKEFGDLQNKGNNILVYNFLPSESKDFVKNKKILEALLSNPDFNFDNKNLEIFLNEYGIDLFLITAINKIISKLTLNNFDKSEIYINFSKYVNEVIKNKNYNNTLKDLLSLYLDCKIYWSTTKEKISEETGLINQDIFEALLYGFRFCVNSINLENDERNDENIFLFTSILSKKCLNILENSLIPGNDDDENDLHIENLEFIERYFNFFDYNHGCYVCSCGFCYIIGPPGFPCCNRSSICPLCRKTIGGGPKVIEDKGATNHGMAIRPGHYRIFENKEEKRYQMNRWGDTDENIPNMIYEDYMKEVVLPITQKKEVGFNTVEKYQFEREYKKVRKLSNIGYRLLNFIAYSHLFYSFCLGNLPKNKLDECLIKDCTILKIIEIDWNLLKKALRQKDIDSVQIFINMIFKDLIKLIKKYKITQDYKEREKFENQVEELISKYLLKYPNYSKTYKKENTKYDFDPTNLKNIVTEMIPPNSEYYSEKEYPMFKYFIYTRYKSEDDMFNRISNKDRYPLINQLVVKYSDIKKLKYLPAFNDFTNYMVNYYSFKISREEARNKPLVNEEIIKEKEFNKKYKNFIEAWDNIKSEAVKYKCRDLKEIKKGFNKNDKLINFLNDSCELKYGMYLASACQNFIQWQNEFLMPIVNANINNGILHKYVSDILKKTPVQEAKPEQILLIEEKFKQSENNFVDFNDVIYACSQRNIFGEDGKINYSNYNSFEYDYDRIEEELGKIILPGARLFEGEDKLNFIIYKYEEFGNNNSDIISQFYFQYPQICLDIKEKKQIINYISNMNKKNKSYNFQNFFSSLKKILYYLAKKIFVKKDETIFNIIKTHSENLELSNDCENFFNNEGKDLTLNKMMNIFNIFEHLCFKELSDNLSPEYKMKISKELKDKIVKNLLNKKNDKITVKDLAASTRRLISRYLTSKISDIDEKRDLVFELNREELWEENIKKLDDFEELLMEKMKDIKLVVGQAYEFYNLIGDEDKKIEF